MPLKELESFSVSHLSVLDEEGNLDVSLEPDLREDELKRLYRTMLKARQADNRLLNLQRQGRLGTFAPSIGQEAVSCGAALSLSTEDWFVGAFRELGGLLLRGMPLERYMLYYNGHEEGNFFPGSERTLPITVIVGSQMLHATGIAYALHYRAQRAAVLVFAGDGATSTGDFHEALNFAAVWKAPVVFVVQNNQYAISIPRSRQTVSATLAQKAIAHGLPGLQVDGNDALAMVKAARDALERARSGGGPSLIEANTYRLMMHTTADDPSRYRTEEEAKEWWKRDPLPRLRRYLEGKNLWDEDAQAKAEAEIAQEIEAAVQNMEAFGPLRPDAAFDHVYGTKHERIEEQRADFLANLEARAGND